MTSADVSIINMFFQPREIQYPRFHLGRESWTTSNTTKHHKHKPADQSQCVLQSIDTPAISLLISAGSIKRPAHAIRLQTKMSRRNACVYALLGAQAVLTLMPRMKGTGASSRSSILSWTGSTGSSRDCHAKGRMRGMSDRTDALSTPMLGQNTAICRSSSAAAQQTQSEISFVALPRAQSRNDRLRTMRLHKVLPLLRPKESKIEVALHCLIAVTKWHVLTQRVSLHSRVALQVDPWAK